MDSPSAQHAAPEALLVYREAHGNAGGVGKAPGTGTMVTVMIRKRGSGVVRRWRRGASWSIPVSTDNS